MTNKKTLASIALLVTFFIWGTTIPVIKITLTEIPPFTLAFLRFSIAGLLITPFFIFTNNHHPIHLQDLPRLIIVALLGPTLTNLLSYLGLKRTSAIDAGVIQALFPIGMAIVGVIFLSEKIRTLAIIGTIVSTLGTLLIIGQPLIGQGTGKILESLSGDFLVLASVATWIAYTIGSKELFDKYNHLTVTAISFLAAVLAIFPFMILEYFQNPSWPHQITITGVLGVAIIIVFSSLFAYFFYEWSLKYVSAHRVGFISHSQPLFTLIAAHFLLGEAITVPIMIGALMIIGGVFAATYHITNHVHRGH